MHAYPHVQCSNKAELTLVCHEEKNPEIAFQIGIFYPFIHTSVAVSQNCKGMAV